MKSYAGLISTFTRAEIDQLFASGRACARTAYFTLLAAPRSKKYARIVVITSKKIGSAVVRNRIRRRVKAIFYQEQFPQTALYDYALIARAPMAALSYERLKELLCTHLANAH